ncbi:pyridoxal kinase-like [Ctenocephalides felis]|uniref:pyridoxal kinase-like n=1 Tax=Ctenocephalides felis TaxID=7515 RepID=UPI000E6E1534|nr:pyridoxal kinase-like [Ctenocephalides felis]
MCTDLSRVLSIQSHVVSGYVGNKSATFPLQVLGFEVDTINSVQFSNHTGYKHVRGQVLTDKELGELAEGLALNGINVYSHLLTGYVANPDFLKTIANVVKELREKNPKLTYVCDPVLGDNGKMYVPESLLPIYRELIIPLADIVTPNQFEVELLTGCKIHNIDDAWKCTEWFHSRHVHTVVVSSSDLGDKDIILMLGSQNEDGKRTRVVLKIPKINASFTGVGDLFAALFLAHSQKTRDFKLSLEKSAGTLQAVLKRTLEYSNLAGGDTSNMKYIELKLIQSKKDIEDPQLCCKAEVVS